MRFAWLLTLGAIAACTADGGGVNRHPVRLRRPAIAPLSEAAQVGRLLFFDSSLSASGRVSCGTCHQPDRAYASERLTAPLGRAVPSLRYTYRTPNFSIGPATSDADEPTVAVGSSVPRGGLFWDGRANTLETQAMGPLLNPQEMGNRDVRSAARRLRLAAAAPRLAALFGRAVLKEPRRLVDEAMFAVARFQIEDPSFHPYTSAYDAFLEGAVTLSPSARRGRQAFEDPARGNCAACHVDRVSPNGIPPAFTDYEYAALGVPRNVALAGSPTNDVAYDLGLCGPARHDLRASDRYCGLFRTPSLRNVATRSTFFHNGAYRTLEQVLAFYAFRDTRPERVYPVDAQGTARKFDDMPSKYWKNVDTVDAPFDRKPGQPAALSEQDMRDIIAFLETLTDRDLRPRKQSP